MGQLDPCHYNFTIFDFMLKSMPLSGMIFNVKPNFTELWWHESNFPLILKGSPIPFIEEPHVMIDEAYLVQGHILKKGPDDSLVFFSLGYANEIQLPNAGYHLYNCRSLTIPLVPQEESRRHSVSGLPAS
jgi:hypothetical protein